MKKVKGLIKSQISNQYTVIELNTKKEYKATPSGKLRYVRVDEKSSFNQPYGRRTKKDQKTIQISPKVGDVVDLIFSEDKVLIDNIYPRKNELIRPDVSNVDQVLLVFSATKPEFSFNLLDKFLVIIKNQKLDIVLLVTKIDLIDEKLLNELKEKLKYYEENVNIKTIYVNSKEINKEFKHDNIFENKITVLAGQTGVGKSTFLNSLIPNLKLKTQEISKSLGRGRHTTRHLELYDYKSGYICDTPGFSRLDLKMYEKEDLKFLYEDFVKLSVDCKFSTCNHITEPGCKVKSEYENGNILKERYENYKLFFNEIKMNENKY